jgi:hypothetical protein
MDKELSKIAFDYFEKAKSFSKITRNRRAIGAVLLSVFAD